jgi:hypothetical protein
MNINKFKYNNSFILSRFSFHYQGKFHDFNGLICLNFDGKVLNVGFQAKDEEWSTSYKPFEFDKMCLIQFREFDKDLHEKFVSKEYKPCDCGKDSEFTWVSGYCGYILCGHCNGKIAF